MATILIKRIAIRQLNGFSNVTQTSRYASASNRSSKPPSKGEDAAGVGAKQSSKRPTAQKWNRIESPSFANVAVQFETSDNSRDIVSAFTSGDIERGFELLQDLSSAGQMPSTNAILSYWDYCQDQTGSQNANVQRMLHYIEAAGIHVTKASIGGLKLLLENENCAFRDVQIDSSRICPNCSQSLSVENLTSAENKALKEAFTAKITAELKQKHAKEWKYLESVTKQKPPFDFVVDGLNVAFANKSSKFSVVAQAKTIQSMIEYFAKRKKRVLLVSRKHFLQFPDEYQKYINANSRVLLLKNTASDDEYLMYAALMCSRNTKLVSRDLFRDHQRRLTPEERHIFRKWQMANQFAFRIDADGQFELMSAARMNSFAQKIGDHWHIPYASEVDVEHSVHTPIADWLCLKMR